MSAGVRGSEALNLLFYSCRTLVEGDPIFKVPEIIDELTTARVITMELISGVPLDSCVDLDQEIRNKVRVCVGMWR